MRDMDIEEARRIVNHAQRPQFGAVQQIAADRFLAEAKFCPEWLAERDAPVMMAGLCEWFQRLETHELVEIENLLFKERRSRRT